MENSPFLSSSGSSRRRRQSLDSSSAWPCTPGENFGFPKTSIWQIPESGLSSPSNLNWTSGPPLSAMSQSGAARSANAIRMDFPDLPWRLYPLLGRGGNRNEPSPINMAFMTCPSFRLQCCINILAVHSRFFQCQLEAVAEPRQHGVKEGDHGVFVSGETPFLVVVQEMFRVVHLAAHGTDGHWDVPAPG